MPRPKGTPKTGGRRKGTANKATEEIRALAQPWAPRAIKEAARIAGLVPNKPGSDSDQARMAAVNTILDRAYGKPKQPVEGEMLVGISEELRRFIAGNDGRPRHFVGFEEEDQQSQD